MTIGKDENMYFTYILKSEKNNRYYIGSTNNIERRISEHNSGKTKSLKFLRPLQVVFTQEFKTAKEARIMEWNLKKFKSRDILDRIVKDQEITKGL